MQNDEGRMQNENEDRGLKIEDRAGMLAPSSAIFDPPSSILFILHSDFDELSRVAFCTLHSRFQALHPAL
jgi:hypothetical protein